jgi:hypothetical protein
MGGGRRFPIAGLCLVIAALVSVAATPASATPARVASELGAARAPARELALTRTIALPGGGIVYRFQQRVAGLDVLGGEAVVSSPPGAPPGLVADATRGEIDPPPKPHLGDRRAISIATAATGVERLRGRRKADLAIAPRAGGTLAWRVIVPSARPLAEYEVLVDAVSGGVVGTRDLLWHLRSGKAKLYNPNPVVEQGGYVGLRSDHNDQNTRLLNSLRRRVTLSKIKGGQDCLRGKWAHAREGSPAHEVCRRSLDWRKVKRADDSFEALMAYYHITRAQRYIRKLGFSGSGGINDRSQLAIANGHIPGPDQDNSFYEPGSRKIVYGAGGVDDAEDADVILHEYGHAMQDDQEPGYGRGNDARSIGEGFGDYWAAAMSSRSPGPPANRWNVCIFDWDGISYSGDDPPCGRRADDPRTLSLARFECFRQIHCVGQVWSSALWDVRKAIGGPTMDEIVLASQFEYVDNERFPDAAQALLNADQSLNGGANEATICAEMETQRGISVPGCP